ncbi:MAG: DNA primase [Haloplanus sp.]
MASTGMNAKRTGAILMTALLLVSTVAPAAVSAQTEESLSLDVTQSGTGAVVVSVTDNGTAVENAMVNVTANDTYTDAGEFGTDANGTVTLANPETPIELTITATAGNDTATTTVTVEPVRTLAVGVDQADGGTVTASVGRLGEPVANATVTVAAEGNGSYVAAGEYETDDTGTVVLPAPSEAVTVTAVATADGDTAATTVELEPPEPVGPFGRTVSAFVDALKGAGFTGIGSQVSDFVTSSNPSNAGGSDAVSSSEAGTNASVTPPGQEMKNESRVVPASPPVENPGKSGSAPGRSDTDTDEEDGDTPGKSGSAPGRSNDNADEENGAPDDSESTPGQSDDDDAEDEESNEGEGDADSNDEDDNADGDADSDDSNGNAGGNGNGNGR